MTTQTSLHSKNSSSAARLALATLLLAAGCLAPAMQGAELPGAATPAKMLPLT